MQPKLPQADIETLKKDITDMKTDILYLKKIVLQIKEAKSSSADASDLKKLEDTMITISNS